MKITSFKAALIATIGLRLTCSLLMVIFSWLVPVPDCPDYLCSQETQQTLTQKSTYSRLFLAPWYRWDSVRYLEISENGYQSETVENSVWPLLYPLLIRGLSGIMLPMQAALILSTFFTFLAFYLLHINVCQIWGKDIANFLLVIMSVFPSSFFFMGAFTESMFLCLSLGTILLARRRKWVWAGLCGVLASMTRQIGVFLVLPFLWEIYEAYFKKVSFNWKEVISPLFCASLIPLQTGINYGYVHYFLKMSWPWETISNYWGHQIALPWAGMIGNIIYLFTKEPSVLDISVFYDLILSILFLIALLVKTPKMPLSYRIFGAVCLLPNLIFLKYSRYLSSSSRYVLPIFPVFITLAIFLHNRKKSKLAWLAFSLISFFLLLLCFYKWIWVA